MRIAFFSDIHVDASTAGVERFEELRNYVDTLVEAVKTESVDLVCFCGDAYDPGSLQDPKWSSFMIETALRLTIATPLHGSVFIPGNHDVIDSSEPLSTMTPLATMVKTACMTRLSVHELPDFTLYNNGPRHGARKDSSTVGVLSLPYVSRAVERTERYQGQLGHVFEAARTMAGERTPIIAIGHYSIPGLEPGSEGDMMRGRDLWFPTSRMKALRPTLIVNGHYHERQTVDLEGLSIEIVGAPARFSFGESDNGSHGFLLAEV